MGPKGPQKEHLRVSAILLAAGESKRMGQMKQLMPFGRSTILGEAINNLLSSAVNEVILVLGYKADEVIRTSIGRPVKLVINPYYWQGMSTSIIAGMNHVDTRAQAIMIALGDQPLISSQTINTLIKEFQSHDKGIAVPTYRGKRGHPIIFGIKYKRKLLELKGDIGGRKIIEDHPDDVLEVEVASESVVVDFDTKNDYRGWVGQFES